VSKDTGTKMKNLKNKRLETSNKKITVRKKQKSPRISNGGSLEFHKLIENYQNQQIELELQNNELQRAHIELEYAQHKYYDLFDQAPVGYLNITRKYKILEANYTASNFLDVEKKYLLKQIFTRFIDKDYVGIFLLHMERVITSGGKEQFEIKLKRNNNNSFWALIECSFNYEDGKAEVIKLTITDITRRKQTEDVLKESEDNLRAILNATTESIFMFDSEGRIVSGNSTAAKKLKHTLPETIGHQFSEFMNRELAIARQEYINKVFKSGLPVQFEDERDGIIFQHNFYPIFENEKVVRVVSYSQDITVNKKWEEQLNKLNHTLNALRHNSDAILRATDEESYMQEVCNIILEDCGYAMIWIGFAENDEYKTIRPVVSAGLDEGYIQKLKVTWADTERGRGPSGTAIRTGKPSICNNMLTDPNFKPWRAEAIKRGYASSVSLPLRTTEKVFGAIAIYSDQSDSFKEDELSLLSELAEDFTYGLSVVKLRASHAIAVEELKKHRDHLEELVEYRTSELLNANEILKEAQEVAHFGNWRLDLTTNYLEWSDEVYRIFGIEPGSFGASLESFLSIVHPDDRAFVANAFANSVKNKTFYNIHHKIIRPDGEIRIVHEQCVTHYDKNEQPIYSLGVVQDITELKKIEKEIELHRAHLEELVKVRTEELNVANRKLREEIEKEKQVEMLLQTSLEKEKELNELKSRFISTTSHEFRTPLASILSSVQLIQRYRHKWSDEKLEDQFVKVKSSIFNLTSLLDDILTISRADSGKIVFNPQKLNLYNYCLELYDEVKHKATENHKFIFKCTEKEREFTLDPKLMRFIIGNLLSNAFKYSPSGGKVVLKVTSDQNELQISVSDEGLGISAEDKNNLFKPFFRAKNSKDIEGTGLGLSIVLRAVQMHKGEITFQSTEGKGTMFFVKIPVE
jgi:PAS domain S-box-containing protein